MIRRVGTADRLVHRPEHIDRSVMSPRLELAFIADRRVDRSARMQAAPSAHTDGPLLATHTTQTLRVNARRRQTEVSTSGDAPAIRLHHKVAHRSTTQRNRLQKSSSAK
jgi:hypothetical protein